MSVAVRNPSRERFDRVRVRRIVNSACFEELRPPEQRCLCRNFPQEDQVGRSEVS